jgi:hypothetical protein
MSQATDSDWHRLALQMVEAKGHANDEIKEEVVQEVLTMLEDAVNLELLSRMSKDQMDEFNVLLADDGTTNEQIVGFVYDCGIDIKNVNTVALTKFRVAYLGA